jgi:hypothetical protein
MGKKDEALGALIFYYGRSGLGGSFACKKGVCMDWAWIAEQRPYWQSKSG